MHTLSDHRTARIKRSFTTRRVRADHLRTLDAEATDLRPGDLVLAKITGLGQHRRIELPDGRRAHLYPGDEVLLACGARYAPDQFEADCPTGVGPAHLAAAGGVAGVVCESHDRMRSATAIEILGAVGDGRGRRLTLRDYVISPHCGLPTSSRPAVVVVCGTSMNAGKTFTAASWARGFALGGHTVAAVKLTGTGAGGDLWQFKDAGAHWAADFTDAGFATTYRAQLEDILAAHRTLIRAATARRAEVVVVEIADGLAQSETAALLRSAEFRGEISGVLFAAADSLGAGAGVNWLRAAGHNVLGVSGVLTRSPLAMRETRELTEAPCLTAQDLSDPGIARSLAGLGADIAAPAVAASPVVADPVVAERACAA